MQSFLGLLMIEGLAEAVLAMVAFAATGASWWLFLALAPLPDLAIAAYLAGPRAGAFAYNAAHSHVGPALLGAAALLLGSTISLAVAAVWFAHIGIDRALGYGLKSTAGFRFTHLGEIGGRRDR